MNDKPFNLGKKVIERIKNANFEAYFVGGCVRDLLLERPIEDIDIATSAKPADIIKLFDRVIPIGIEHGTVLVRYHQTSFEITTFRVDGTYSDQRHPDSVKYVNQIDEDLKRRDFTINALAMDEKGNIIDLFQGTDDLNNRIIQTVGDGYDRFLEDPLRIIRALRFSSQLGFTIEENTLHQMMKVKSEIQTIAVERITAEMTKFFAGNYIDKGIYFLMQTEIYKHLPVFKERPTLMPTIAKYIKPLDSFAEVIAFIYMLEPKIPIINWIKEWKCSNKTRREATTLINALQYFDQNGLNTILVYNLPEHLYSGFIRLCELVFSEQIAVKELTEIHNQLPIKSPNELNITGNDLITLYPNLKKGPWIKHMLDELTEQVLLTTVENKRQKLREWVKCNPPEMN